MKICVKFLHAFETGPYLIEEEYHDVTATVMYFSQIFSRSAVFYSLRNSFYDIFQFFQVRDLQEIEIIKSVMRLSCS